MSKKNKFTTVSAARRLVQSMEIAIDNMIEEVKKPLSPDISGGARKAELQAIKQTATDCKELLLDRKKLEDIIVELETEGSVSEKKDFTGGFAESYSK